MSILSEIASFASSPAVKYITALSAIISAIVGLYWICVRKSNNKKLTEFLIEEIRNASHVLSQIQQDLSTLQENHMLNHEFNIPSTTLYSANLNKLEQLEKNKISLIKLSSHEIDLICDLITHCNDSFKILRSSIINAGLRPERLSDIDFSGLSGFKSVQTIHREYMTNINTLRNQINTTVQTISSNLSQL